MTTIASDGRHVAADSQATVNDYRCTAGPKIIQREGYVFALAGAIHMFEPMIAWWLRGHKREELPPVHKDDTFAFAVFFADRVWCYDEGCANTNPREYPFACGSGQKYAIGAITAGVPAEAAVRAAARLDIGSSEPIVVYPLPTIRSTDTHPNTAVMVTPARRKKRSTRR